MRKLHYAGGYVLIADQTCKALLRYARALARSVESDVVTIPVINEEGSRGYGHLLIGPSSMMFSTPVANAAQEPLDDRIVAELERRTAELQPTRPEWPDEMTDIAALPFDFEFGI